MNRLTELFLDLDMYGHAIGVHYRGRGAYKTRLGALLTLATYVLMTVNMVSLFIAFNDGSKQEEKDQSMQIDTWTQESVNIAEKNVDLSVFSEGLSPDVGRIIGYQYFYDEDR